MDAQTTNTLAILREAMFKAGNPGDLAKSNTFVSPTSATVGLQTYNLEAPAKNLYPVLSPIRNEMPRVKATGGIQANWKAVTGINTTNVSVGIGEGQRGGNLSVATQEFFAAFRTIGIEASVTEEAELSAEGYDDLRARAANSGLQALMIAEERLIIGGCSSLGLGQTGTPTLAQANSGGALVAGSTLSVICVALTMEGVANSSLATGVPAQITRQNVDGTSTSFGGGAAIRSPNTTITIAAGNNVNTVTASVAPTQGGAGYAWFWGTVGNEQLGAITNYSQVVITALTASGFLSTSLTTDNSTNSLVFDGLLTLNAKTATAYWKALAPGASLTADGFGGVVEFDEALRWYYDTLRAAPSRIWLSSQEMQTIKTKFLGGTGNNTSTRFVFNVQAGQIMGGGLPKGYLNMFAGAANGANEIPLMLHPYMPPGTIVFEIDKLPYPMNNVNNVRQILTRRDYYQREWVQTTRSYQYGVYSDEVLQHYFPVGIAVISNIAP